MYMFPAITAGTITGTSGAGAVAVPVLLLLLHGGLSAGITKQLIPADPIPADPIPAENTE